MNKILLVFAIFSLFLFGCTSSTGEKNEESLNYTGTSNTAQNEENFDSIAPDLENSQDLEKTETDFDHYIWQDLQEGAVVYCIIDNAGVKQELYFAKNEALMKTTYSNVWNKVRIDRQTSCAWDSKIPKQCVDVNEAGGFDEIYQSWVDSGKILGSCSFIEYNQSIFE